MTDWDKVQKQYDERWEQINVLDKEQKARGTILGRYIREQIADGYAFYAIIKENKKTVRIRHIQGIGFDDYVVPYWGYEASIDKKYAKESINGRDALSKIFGGDNQ